MIEFGEVVVQRQLSQILHQLEEFVIGGAIRVRLPERSDAEAVTRIHHEVSADVVEHYGILGRVAREFAPNHG